MLQLHESDVVVDAVEFCGLWTEASGVVWVAEPFCHLDEDPAVQIVGASGLDGEADNTELIALDLDVP